MNSGGSPLIYALSIAGLDPSAGAGMLADIKTMEAFGVYGFGVCSALTYQNDTEFLGVDWVPAEKIIAQLAPLLHRFPIACIKIGLIENLDVLAEIIAYCISKTNGTKLVWDPIMKASAGFTFHHAVNKDKLVEVLRQLYLVTPNIPEALQLTGIHNPEKAATWLSQHTNVLLKGGHSNSNRATDLLYSGGRISRYESTLQKDLHKHGTGCVLSSAIAGGLSKGHALEQSCANAKQYISGFIASTGGLLGLHNYTITQP